MYKYAIQVSNLVQIGLIKLNFSFPCALLFKPNRYNNLHQTKNKK